MFQTHLAKPSTKIISLGIVTLAVIVATILFKSAPQTNKEQDPPKGPAVQIVKNAVTESDSDGDGLKDWEESLWGMSPKNTDSDGNGIGDLAEVQNKKDAEIAARERIVNSATSSFFSFYEQDKNLTRTEAVSRAIFEQVIAFKNAGVPLTQEVATEVASTLGGALVTTPNINENSISLGDLQIIKNATTEQIHFYGNAVAGALKVQTSDQNNEFFALIEFMQTGNPASLSKLTPVVAHYKDVVAKLLLVAVPQEAVENHLNLSNKIQTTATILERLEKLSADPITFLPFLQMYEKNYHATVTALHNIKVYLDTEGIEYGDLEDGFLLVTMY